MAIASQLLPLWGSKLGVASPMGEVAGVFMSNLGLDEDS